MHLRRLILPQTLLALFYNFNRLTSWMPVTVINGGNGHGKLKQIMPLFIICFFINNLAKADNILNHKGFKYSYEKVSITDGKTNIIDNYDGQIRIENNEGKLVY